MSSDVKSRVVARVTGVEFVPKKTVEIGPDQCVVDQLKPDWWNSGNGEKYSLAGNVVTLEDAPEIVAEYEAGGIVKNTEPVIVGEQVSDHVLPRAVVDKLIPVPFTPGVLAVLKHYKPEDSNPFFRPVVNVVLPVPVANDEEDGDFLLDFTDTLRDQVESVVNPDTRVLRSELPPVAVAGTSYVADARDSGEANFQMTHSEAKERLRRIAPQLLPENQPSQKTEGIQPTDYEAAAELNISVHAYRFLTREISLLNGRIEASKRAAVEEALQLVTKSFKDAIAQTVRSNT